MKQSQNIKIVCVYLLIYFYCLDLAELKSTKKSSRPSSARKNKNPLESTNLSMSMFENDFKLNKIDDDISVVDEDELDKIAEKVKNNEPLDFLRDNENEENEDEDEEKKEEDDDGNNNNKRVVMKESFNPFTLFITLKEIEDLPTNLGCIYIYILYYCYLISEINIFITSIKLC